MSGSSFSVRSQPQEKVSFSFYELSLLPGAQENRRTFDIVLSKDDTTFTPLRIGPMNFTRSPVTVRLTPSAGYPGNLVRLRQMRLVLAQDDAITAAPMADNGDALNQAKMRLLEDLASAYKNVIAGYDEKLKTLSKTSSGLSDEIAAETKRLEMLRNEELAQRGDKPLTRILAKMGGVAGFEDIEGAKLIVDTATSGDHLIIEHEGQRIAVRLLWLECAPLNTADESRKGFAKHFSIESASTEALAHAAREFTIGYLSGKPLRLLIRPGKDKDGSQAALVFLPDVGLYQNVLVDQGLAAVRPPVKELPRGLMERSLLGTLLEREANAKRLKNGAWALASEDKR
jgi:endonuclease YncB( thermonuclease family)